MILRRSGGAPVGDRAPAAQLAAGGAPTIDSWLAVLGRLIRLPGGTRQAVCDELREHLRERVRDLVLAGAPERDAVRTAIDELGEAAELARSLERANRNHRTRSVLMNLAMIGLGAAVVTAGVVTYAPPGSNIVASVFQEREVQTEPPAGLERLSILIDTESSVVDVIERIDAVLPQSILINRALIDLDLYRDAFPVAVDVGEIPLPNALALVSRAMEEVDATVYGWRFGERIVEFAPQEVFDRRERMLVSYRVGHVIQQLQDEFNYSYDDATEAVTEVIQEFVEPDGWHDNGGDMATLRIVGGKMFVQAPPRVHTGTAWILSELAEGGELAAKIEQNLPGDLSEPSEPGAG